MMVIEAPYGLNKYLVFMCLPVCLQIVVWMNTHVGKRRIGGTEQ